MPSDEEVRQSWAEVENHMQPALMWLKAMVPMHPDQHFVHKAREKYVAGAMEHGGDIDFMPLAELYDNAMQEVYDAVSYLAKILARMPDGSRQRVVKDWESRR